jgi:hypothetical protein
MMRFGFLLRTSMRSFYVLRLRRVFTGRKAVSAATVTGFRKAIVCSPV